MEQNTQLVIIGSVILLAVVIFVAVWRNMKKQQQKSVPKIQGNNTTRFVDTSLATQQKWHAEKNKVEEVVLDKTVIVKRPGPKVELYGNSASIIAWCMQRAGIRYSKAKIWNRQYIKHGKQPGRKKAQGYWEFTIKYAAGYL